MSFTGTSDTEFVATVKIPEIAKQILYRRLDRIETELRETLLRRLGRVPDSEEIAAHGHLIYHQDNSITVLWHNKAIGRINRPNSPL